MIKLSVFAALALVSQVDGYGYTLADCKAAAKLFKNTCTGAPDTAATWFTNFASTYQSCTYMASCPSGYGTAYNCNWPRLLCVTCSQASSTASVYMRIQSNTLPDHCSVTTGTPPQWTLDYSIKWNPDVSKSTKTTYTSQTLFDAQACKMEKTSTVPSTSVFTNNNSTGYSTANDAITSGIMINGVPMFSSLSGDLVDPYYPQMWTGVKKATVSSEDVDACLGHSGGGVYHYHMLTNCLASSSVDTSKSCADTTACATDVKTFALDAFSGNKTLTLFGIAKDGHAIIGPYATNGSLYDCKYMDQCGGIFLDDGSYAYVMHGAFPYTMNCFGPSQNMLYEASCTTNNCTKWSYTETVTATNSIFFSVQKILFGVLLISVMGFAF